MLLSDASVNNLNSLSNCGIASKEGLINACFNHSKLFCHPSFHSKDTCFCVLVELKDMLSRHSWEYNDDNMMSFQ